MFMQAELFRTASQVLSGHLPDVAIPLAVCSAFSFELYLKCLLLIEGSDPGVKHNLDEMFYKDQLSQPSNNPKKL